MKKITFLLFALITFAFSFQANAQCDYVLQMNDTYCDGWNGNTIDVLVNGIVVLDDVTLADDCDGTLSFSVADGDDVTTVFDESGSYAYETSYSILNNIGVSVGSGNPTSDITTGTITVLCETPPPAPTNIDCANATSIACGETLNVTSIGSTGTSEDIGCSMGVNGLWFTFIGTGLDMTVSSTTGFDNKLAVASGACGSLVNMACVDGFVSGSPETYTFTSVLNETYYVYVAHWSSGNTSTGAVSITLECSTCTPATANYVVVNDCDVSGGFLIDVNVTDMGSATALTVSDNQASPTQPLTAAGTLQFGPYVNGTSVVITINDDGDDDSCTVTSSALTQAVCPSPPPANDDCSGAIGLTVNADYDCGVVTAGTTVGATASSQPDDVTGTPNNDVWYSFTASATGHRISLLNIVNQPGGDTSVDMGMGVYDGTGGCAGLVFFDDSDPETLNLTGLTVGVEYYVRVYGWYTALSYDTFDICVGTAPVIAPPACGENFYDTGGASSNYSANENYTITICPDVPGDAVTATFNSFIVEGSATDTCWDNLFIYDGSDNTGTPITPSSLGLGAGTAGFCWEGVADGTADLTGQAITATNPSGCLTFTFTSDGSGQFAGWDASISCATVGTQDYNMNELFTYYPNPVNNTLTLKGAKAIQDVAVYNMLGQEVLRTAPNMVNSDVDMSNLKAGTYFVKVTVENATKTIKIIKK
jgi:hypothetical protein